MAVSWRVQRGEDTSFAWADLSCTQCQGQDRLHPVEPILPQLRLFLAAHAHEGRTTTAPAP